MSTTRPKVHAWAYPYGDVTHDPWPGDLTGYLTWGFYLFTGTHWRVVQRQCPAGEKR